MERPSFDSVPLMVQEIQQQLLRMEAAITDLRNGENRTDDTRGLPDPVPAKQAYKLLGISPVTGWHYINKGRLKALKIGNRNYFRRAEILAILEGKPEDAR